MASTTARTTNYVNTPDEASMYGTDFPARLRRISWGAILAGVAIALVTMLALNMLGLSIGAATINPLSEAEPVGPGFAAGTMIWFAASNLLSLFAGGFVAGHMSGLFYDNDGVLHGLVTWAVVVLITFFAITTSVGSVISGAMSVASSAISAAGQVAGEVAPEVAAALNVQDMTWQGIQNDMRNLMAANTPNQTGTAGTTDTTTDTTTGAQTAATNTTMGLNEVMFNQALSDMLNGETVDAADRDAVVAMLAENTGISEAEAQATVERWETTYLQVRQDAEETARRVAQAAADAVTAFAGAVFAMLVVGAFAAGVGGMAGTPERHEIKVAGATVTTP